MNLSDLLQGIEYECIQGDNEREVSTVVYDSKEAVQNCLFIGIVGSIFNGNQFAREAVEHGASVVMISTSAEELALPNVTVLRVEDTRRALAIVSANYFGHPSKKLKVIGVTGTKGKTTTTYYIKSILERSGYKVGLIGTIEVLLGERHISTENTTPESYILQKYFAEMVEAGIEIVVMEVSSQALKLHRCDGILFDYAIFTNLALDHIGSNEHESLEEYIACKSLLFRQSKMGIVNGDDDHLEQIIEGHSCDLERFGLQNTYDWCGENIRLTREQGRLGVTFHVTGKMDFDVSLATPGVFSVYNALAAISVCSHLDVDTKTLQKSLSKVQVKGRIELVRISKEFTVLIDYAHNAMALESLLMTLREYHPKRLICLFGCGGNRSKTRRFEMGEVSGKLADLTVVTSDNPRFEDPMEIIGDIRVGLEKTKGLFLIIADRREAVRQLIAQARPGDLIVLAGKGHEDYQEIQGVKYPMDERIILREAVNLGKLDGRLDEQ